ncbi:MAG: hypothetical protein KDA21_06150 [Phycisphaerales bacterium]|nr:hypothetical protein [Phycisphaerales bacterium]
MTAERRNRLLGILALIVLFVALSEFRLVFPLETIARHVVVMAAAFLAVFIIPIGLILFFAEMLAPGEGD